MLSVCDIVKVLFVDPPGKPKNLDIADVDRDHVTLAWEPPESDGNAPIQMYIIERREKSQKEWLIVGNTPASGPLQMTDEKVVEGQEYSYRVKAINKAGPGDACDGKKALVKAKPGG